MEIYFNELSCKKETLLDKDIISEISKIYKELKSYEINVCRIANEDMVYLFEQCKKSAGARNLLNFLFAFFKAPYESESVLEKEEEYYKHKWICSGEECSGFALAYMMQSLTLSLNISVWDKPNVDVMCDEEMVEVRNISRTSHILVHSNWLENLKEVVLVKCDISENEKIIKLSDDHGKDILLEFSQGLIRNEYVCGVISSLPYSSHKRKFIKEIYEDGCIDIVLPWTDRGLSIRIKTTGRNIRETREIAKILEKKYGYIR